jgi:hypothetical protein
MLLEKWSQSYDLAELYFAMYALYLQYQHLYTRKHPRLLDFFFCWNGDEPSSLNKTLFRNLQIQTWASSMCTHDVMKCFSYWTVRPDFASSGTEFCLKNRSLVLWQRDRWFWLVRSFKMVKQVAEVKRVKACKGCRVRRPRGRTWRGTCRRRTSRSGASGRPGSDFMILKMFSPKRLAFFAQTS